MSLSLTGFRNPAGWLINFVRGIGAGWDEGEKTITSENALTYAPIWYGVTKIAGHISQLPLHVYQRVEKGGEKQRQHPVSRLLRRPNPYQTKTVFFEQCATHSILEGNGRAAIVRSGSRIQELLPLHPESTATGMIAGVKVHATRPPKDDRLRMFFKDVSGEMDGEGVIMLDDVDVVHVPGLTLDGICGVPLREIAKRNLNASINTEKRIGKQMEQGFSGSLMLQAPPGVFRRAEDAEEFLNYFEARHNSPEKAGKVGMLREGMTANILQTTNQEAEMIENRKFQRQDAALWLGLEQILGDDSSVSYNSLEQKNLAYLMNCLNRWLKRWEEELDVKLLPSRQYERDTHYIKFSTSALLRSDYQTTVEALGQAITARIISPNEAREKLDMLPYEGGDEYANPAITPGQGGQDDAETEAAGVDQSEDAPVANLHPAIRARFERLIAVECTRVKQSAKKPDDFRRWLPGFYDKWQAKFADACEELGVDRDAATAYCDDSRQRLLAVCDNSSESTLQANVAELVKTWKFRAEHMGAIEHV